MQALAILVLLIVLIVGFTYIGDGLRRLGRGFRRMAKPKSNKK